MAQSPHQGPFVYTATTELTASNTAQNLSESTITRTPSGGGTEKARYVYIQVQDNDLAWAYETTLLSAQNQGYRVLPLGDIELYGEDAISNFAYRNWTDSSNATLVVTVGF